MTRLMLAIGGIIAALLGVFVLTRPSTPSIQTANYAPSETVQHLQAPKGNIRLLIADTPESTAKGLGQRSSLDHDQGMLFIFPAQSRTGFWMKDMKFPIDIIWIDSSKTVVDIQSEVSPDSYPEVYYPPSLISYVLEVNAGTSKQFGIATGTALVF